MMVRYGILSVAITALVSAGVAQADCTPASFEDAPPAFAAPVPAPPDPATRPVVPECLANLSNPVQQNCTPDVIKAYSASIAAYGAALQAYVEATNAYANDTVDFANAAADHARRARAFADGALDWARCEVDAINTSAN